MRDARVGRVGRVQRDVRRGPGAAPALLRVARARRRRRLPRRAHRPPPVPRPAHALPVSGLLTERLAGDWQRVARYSQGVQGS